MGIVATIRKKVLDVQYRRAETREFEAWWKKAKGHLWWASGSTPKETARGIWDHMRSRGEW